MNTAKTMHIKVVSKTEIELGGYTYYTVPCRLSSESISWCKTEHYCTKTRRSENEWMVVDSTGEVSMVLVKHDVDDSWTAYPANIDGTYTPVPSGVGDSPMGALIQAHTAINSYR